MAVKSLNNIYISHVPKAFNKVAHIMALNLVAKVLMKDIFKYSHMFFAVLHFSNYPIKSLYIVYYAKYIKTCTMISFKSILIVSMDS